MQVSIYMYMYIYKRYMYVHGLYVMQVTLFIESFELPAIGFIKQFKLNSEIASFTFMQLFS